MNFQTSDSSSRGAPSGSRPSQRATLGQVGWPADHQPQPSAGLRRAKRGNAPSHEYAAQSSGPVATYSLRSLATAPDDASGVTATSHHKSPSKRKVALPAPRVQPPSPSQSPPPSRKAPIPSPAKVIGKRGSSSQEPAGPSSSSKRARRMKERDIRVDAAAAAESTSGTLAVPQPTPVRATTPPPQPTLRGATNPHLVPDLGGVVPMLKTRRQYKAAVQYPSPGENDDINTHSLSDRPIARGGRDKRADATMARRIAEVQRLKERWEHLMDRLNSEERLADPAADVTLEEDMAEATAARAAWKDAERELISPSSTSSPEEPTPAPMPLPMPTPVDADDDTPSMILGMRKPYGILLRYLDAVLPELPPGSTTIGHLAPSSEGIPPSASLPTPAPPTPANAVASTSSTPPAATTFRFSPNEEAHLLELASEQKYRLAIEMIPANQQRLVLRRRSEIAAVREIHAKPKTRRTNHDGTRKVKTHIGEDGVETELWVCRALFKVHKGCGGIDYVESPCGYPVGTKDSWIRHLKDVHLGRVNRGA